VYTHDKNNALRQYLQQKATSETESHTSVSLDQLTDITKVFDIIKMKDMLKEHNTKSNLHRNHQRFITYLGDTQGVLQLATVPPAVADELDQLFIDFPNFLDVINHYRQDIALSLLTSGRAFSSRPLLISGPPGVGKTAFCNALAKIMQTYFVTIGMSGVTAGFVLGGMSSGWADGKPGKIVESLAQGHKANPLILIDEIDKISGDTRYDPLGALYQLLERDTAISFIDEGLEISVNCAHIVYVATANQTQHIPDAILSRFAIIEVKQPNSFQMKKVLQSIYKKIRNDHEWGVFFAEQLPENVIEKVISSRLAPRLIQRELISSCGSAALSKQRSNIGSSCFELRPDDYQPGFNGEQEIKMGFMH